MKKENSIKLVKSAIRTMSLFAVFADAGRALSLGEIAERMDAPKSSCYELLQTLMHLGYVTALDGGRNYYPSRRLYDLVEQINRFNPIKEKIQAELKNLRNLTGETVIIGRLHGTSVVYTEVFDGTHTIRYSARSGDLRTIHASALGKALLGSLEDGERERLLDELELEHFNDSTITDREALKSNLADCIEQGVYTTVGEHLPDVMAMAYPIKVQGHQLAISIAGPIPRMERNFKSYAQTLLKTAENIQA